MNITYRDYHPNYPTNYQGTIIKIVADSKEEWRKIQGIFINRCMKYNGTWFYRPKAGKRYIEAIGYDAFLASLVEREITGDRVFYLGKSEKEIGW